jgi:hypothetical protein
MAASIAMRNPSSSPARALSSFTTLCAAGLLFGVSACSGDSPVALETDSATLYWALHTDIPAATVALGGTQQLTATPVYPSGGAIAGLAAPSFRSADSSKVKVTTGGLVTGVALTPGTAIIASLTVNGVTNVDTTLVAVTATSAVVTDFVLDGSAPYTVTSGSSKFIMPSVRDNHGVPLFGLAVKYRSLDTITAAIQPQTGAAVLSGMLAGKVLVIATTTSYGVTVTDTIEYRVVNPTSITINCVGSATPFPGAPTYFPTGPYLIQTGGSINFSNASGAAQSITFTTGLANVPGGNIASLSPGPPVTRTFPTAGSYRFVDAYGNAGLVVAQDPTP